MLNPSRPSRKVTVVGAGIAGLTTAILLARRGHQVDIFEQRPDPRGTAIPRGRSINFTLSSRGAAVLDRIGLRESVLKKAVPLRGRVLHLESGRTVFQPYGNSPSEILYAVNRAELNKTLLEAALSSPNVRATFDAKCTAIEKKTATARFACPESVEETQADFIVGADGAFSAVRRFMQNGERADFRQDFSAWGYKELTVPANEDGTSRLYENALHLWSRRDSILCGIPNHYRSFVCTLIAPFDGPNGFEALHTRDAIERYMKARFADALELMPDYVEEFLAGPSSPIVTTGTTQWHHGGRVVILGDACHAVSPFIGQGMNAALQDSLALDESLERHEADTVRAFRDFQEARKPEADALAVLSAEHLSNLKDNLGSPWALAQVRADLALNRLLPGFWKPLYTLVAHTSESYAVAIRRAAFQRRIGWLVGVPLLRIAHLTSLLADELVFRIRRAMRGPAPRVASGSCIRPRSAAPKGATQ